MENAKTTNLTPDQEKMMRSLGISSEEKPKTEKKVGKSRKKKETKKPVDKQEDEEFNVRVTPLLSKDQKDWLDYECYKSKRDGNIKTISSIIRDLIDRERGR